MAKSEKPCIGISQCLLGEPVRYDGGHKRSDFCTTDLAPFVIYVPVCPEMGIGLGAPREPIHLQGTADNITVRVVGNVTPTLDVTDALTAYGQARARELDQLSGYIFMQRSPSCGLERIPVYDAEGQALSRTTRGLYAQTITQHHPLLPVIEEGQLRDAQQRENFLTRVYAYQRWQTLRQQGLTVARLQDFHARHKYLLLAHQQAAYRHLGQIVARADQHTLESAAQDYLKDFMQALAVPATRHNHSNVLLHIMGYLKRDLEADSKQELLGLIDDYQLGKIPLSAPLARLRQHFDQHPSGYIDRQFYWEPYPPELAPRSAPQAHPASPNAC